MRSPTTSLTWTRCSATWRPPSGRPRSWSSQDSPRGWQWRTAPRCAGRAPARAIVVAGGDLPPELADNVGRAWPTVLIATGGRDTYYTPELLERDAATLAAQGADVRRVVFDGGHEWAEEMRDAAGELLREVSRV